MKSMIIQYGIEMAASKQDARILTSIIHMAIKMNEKQIDGKGQGQKILQKDLS